ncbi:flagellar hook-length control protein FliK [Thiogranum longum]
MFSSIPTLPLPLDSSGGFPGIEANVSEKQLLIGGGEDFMSLLGQLRATLAGTAAPGAPVPLVVENLNPESQNLPQGGNPLPLPQPLPELTADSSGVLQRLPGHLAPRSQGNETVSELLPAQTAVALAYPVTGDGATVQGLAGPGSVAVTGSQAGVFDALRGRRSPPQMPHRQLVNAETAGELPRPELAKDSNGPVFDRTLAQLPYQAQALAERQPELAGVMAALKRVTTAGKPPVSDTPVRTDALSVAAPAPGSQAAAPSAVVGSPVLSVDTPLQQAEWAQAFGERIRWMVSNKLQGAQIRLNPAHLGPMEVRIQMQNDQATIQFSSAHAVVRDALEAALPRLRDMLDASGVELVDVDVSGQSFAEQRRTADRQQSTAWSRLAGVDHDDSAPVTESSVARVLEAGRLDLFA